MLACQNRIYFLSISALVVFTGGCRNLNPLTNSVQVTREQSHDIPNVDGPPQRLVTAKPRAGSDMTSGSNVAPTSHAEPVSSSAHVTSPPLAPPASEKSATQSSISPHSAVSRSARPQSVKSHSTKSRGKQQSVGDLPVTGSDLGTSPSEVTQRLLTDRNEVVRQANTQVESITRTLTDVSSETTARLADASSSVQRLPPETQEMLEAFRNSPPEVQEQALRQLIATASLTADSTTQPKNIEESLKRSLAKTPSSIANPSSSPKTGEPTSSKADAKPEVSLAHLLAPAEDSGAVRQASHSESNHQPIEKQLESAVESQVSSAHKKEHVTKGGSVSDYSDAALLAELKKRLSTPHSSDEPETQKVSRIVTARYLDVLSGNVDDAVTSIEGLDHHEQEYLRNQLLALATIIQADGHPVAARRFAATLPQLREATLHLAAATDALDVKSLAFCTEIESFGQIKPFPNKRFQPGQQVILYCEIDNFVANKVGPGYETSFQGSYDIFNDAGEKVASQVLPADKQVSNNYLRDYFIAYQMHLPKELPSGKYHLKLTLEDLNGKKYGQNVIDFDLAASAR